MFSAMTEAEEDKLFGRMVRERRQLRTKISCLSQKLSDSQKGMDEASEAVNLASQDNWSRLEQGFNFLSADDLTETLKELRDAKARLAELEERLGACC